MSEEQNTQAVVDETKVPAEPGAEVTSARDDDSLESLLAEFDKGNPKQSEPAKPEPRAEAANDVKDATAEVLAARDEIRNERFQRDMNATIKEVRGDLPSDFYDDDFMVAWLDSMAKKDARLAQAWGDRNQNPQQFARVKAALAKDFAKRYGKIPDKQVTEDREAVTAAVRGASTKAPEGKSPDYSKMTDQELAAEWDKIG